MTVRETLGPKAEEVHDRLNQVLDSEDAIIVLMDRSGVTSYCHGFGASGCQLELLWHEVDGALRALIHGTGGGGRSAVATAYARPEY